MTKETLDKLSKAQATDSILMVPAQHPQALSMREGERAWTVLGDQFISKGMSRDVFETEDEKKRKFEEHPGMNDVVKKSEGEVRCHRIDPKASFGVILDGRETSEMTKAWEVYSPSPDLFVENVYSEVRFNLMQREV